MRPDEIILGFDLPRPDAGELGAIQPDRDGNGFICSASPSPPCRRIKYASSGGTCAATNPNAALRNRSAIIQGQYSTSCHETAVAHHRKPKVALVEMSAQQLDDGIIIEMFEGLHALQCGFYTPGMLIMARDILLRISNPTAETVRDQLSGQICRCTGYAGIVKAIVAAARELGRTGATTA